MRSVFPPDTLFLPVGGITPDAMAEYVAAGAAGFGLGSALYAPGDDAAAVAGRARAFAAAWARLTERGVRPPGAPAGAHSPDATGDHP
jgi:2-dehydro-3-deoxyphosphogalactonate aldolase